MLSVIVLVHYQSHVGGLFFLPIQVSYVLQCNTMSFTARQINQIP